MSRAALPKQLLRLRGERTMIQDTVLRAQLPGAAALPSSATMAIAFLWPSRCRRSASNPPRSFWSRWRATPRLPQQPWPPSSPPNKTRKAWCCCCHRIISLMTWLRFTARCRRRRRRPRDGHLVTFGISPTRAETGYGYIRQRGAARGDGVFDVEAFVEKPDAAKAATYLASGDYCWNSGMFAFRARYVPRRTGQI